MIELTTEHIKEIKKISSELGLTTKGNLKKFNNKIHVLLHEILFEKNDYLYSTLLFIKDNSILDHQFFLGSKIEKKSYLNNYIKNIQRKLSQELRQNHSTIGISNKVIDSKINGIVLYYDNLRDDGFTAKAGDYVDLGYDLNNVSIPKEIQEKIFNQKLDKLENELKGKKFYSDFIKDKESLENIKTEFNVNNIDLLTPILSLYYLSIPDIKSNFYSYFIKPDTSHDHYNGLFNLTLTRALKSNELATLNLILFYIFSEIALKDTSDKIEEEANEKYQVELAHIINGNLGRSLNLINNGKGKFSKEDVEIDNIEVLYKLLKRTERRSKIFLDLYKKQRGLLEYEMIKFRNIPFLEIIEDALENNISNNISYSKAKEISSVIKSNRFENLKKIIKTIQLKVEKSIELILYNGIHNAIKFSQNLDNFNITIYNETDHIKITIINDKKMGINLVDSINENFKYLEENGFGLITIKKICDSIKNLSIEVTFCNKDYTNFNIIVSKDETKK